MALKDKEAIGSTGNTAYQADQIVTSPVSGNIDLV